MLLSDSRVRVWLCTEPADMRCSFNGLSARVKNRLGDNPLNGSLYVFINRKRTQMKILYFDGSGYAVWAKRLERGQFVIDSSGPDKQSISLAQLQCLLEGIEWRHARRYRRFAFAA